MLDDDYYYPFIDDKTKNFLTKKLTEQFGAVEDVGRRGVDIKWSMTISKNSK